MNGMKNPASFLAQWIVGTLVSTAVLGMLAAGAMWTVVDAVEATAGKTAAAAAGGALFGLLLGAGIGLGQAAAIYQMGISALRWVAHSAVATAVGGAVMLTLLFAFIVDGNESEIVAGLLMGISVGVPLGVGQWLLLRDKLPNAGSWIGVTLAAVLAAFLIGLPLGGEGRAWIAASTLAAIIAVGTGVGMMWLTRSRPALAA